MKLLLKDRSYLVPERGSGDIRKVVEVTVLSVSLEDPPGRHFKDSGNPYRDLLGLVGLLSVLQNGRKFCSLS